MDRSRLIDALAAAENAPGLREAAADLRQRLAPMRVVVVDAHDMRDEIPALSSERHHLYLGASDGHCWSVTADPGQALGVFIAARR